MDTAGHAPVGVSDRTLADWRDAGNSKSHIVVVVVWVVVVAAGTTGIITIVVERAAPQHLEHYNVKPTRMKTSD